MSNDKISEQTFFAMRDFRIGDCKLYYHNGESLPYLCIICGFEEGMVQVIVPFCNCCNCKMPHSYKDHSAFITVSQDQLKSEDWLEDEMLRESGCAMNEIKNALLGGENFMEWKSAILEPWFPNGFRHA